MKPCVRFEHGARRQRLWLLAGEKRHMIDCDASKSSACWCPKIVFVFDAQLTRDQTGLSPLSSKRPAAPSAGLLTDRRGHGEEDGTPNINPGTCARERSLGDASLGPSVEMQREYDARWLDKE